MSLTLIQESAKEVRRLSIAGSPLAVGDFRLKKLVAPLEQAGAKAPVFGQVAKSIGELVNGNEAESAARLLHLSTLLNAILYTQGQTTAEGESRELEIFATNCSSTRTPARVLKPLIQALTTSGGGRFEVIKSAFERGAFNDLRLIGPSVQALDDNFPELADLIADKILPGFGAGIIPRLKETFDLKGKKSDGRKLKLMHQLDPAGTLPLCKTALEDGAVDVKVAAIECLGRHEDCLPLVQEQANAKNKVVRAAALEALAGYDRPEIAKLFTDLIKGKALDILAQPFRAIKNRQVVQSLIDEGQRAFLLLQNGDEEQIPRFLEILDCLVKRPEAEEFSLGCFNQGDKLAKLKAPKNSHVTGADVMIRLASQLYGIGSARALEAIVAKRDELATAGFSLALRSALRIWSPEKVFEVFSPLLDQKKGVSKEKSEELQRYIVGTQWDETSRFHLMAHLEPDGDSEPGLKKVVWDPRWLDAAVKNDHQAVVCSLARPGHKAALDYLLKQDDGKKFSDAGFVLRALIRCEYPKVTDYFLKIVTKKTKGAKHFDYELQFLFENARHLPKTDLPRLDEFASKLDEKFVDKFLEALAPLRTPASA
jgi:hypothetical protein